MLERFNIKNLSELQDFAQKLVETHFNAKTGGVILALSGELGAGKTAFVQQLGNVLGVQEQITSPTFTIMRQYDIDAVGFTNLVHIDAYRIQDKSELGPLRFEELFTETNAIVCIEWPSQLGIELPNKTIRLQFEINPDESRTVQVEFQ